MTGNCPHRKQPIQGKGKSMWKSPKILEIAVGLEINSYACAEIA
jgi:coenzyme PQQ precursor peptide PqqA